MLPQVLPLRGIQLLGVLQGAGSKAGAGEEEEEEEVWARTGEESSKQGSARRVCLWGM